MEKFLESKFKWIFLLHVKSSSFINEQEQDMDLENDEIYLTYLGLHLSKSSD